jgi:hypothetical protein
MLIPLFVVRIVQLFTSREKNVMWRRTLTRTSQSRVFRLCKQALHGTVPRQVKRSFKTRFKEDDELGFQGSKPNPEDLSELMEFEADFQEEFNRVVNDTTIPEADKDFFQISTTRT